MSVVVRGATYDDVNLVQLPGGRLRMALRVVRGLHATWEVRGQDTVIPSAPGQVPRNRVRDRLVIEVAGPVCGVGDSEQEQRADLEAALGELNLLFDPTGGPRTLSVALGGGGTKVIECTPLPTQLEGDDAIPSYREVSFELEAVEDDWVTIPAGS